MGIFTRKIETANFASAPVQAAAGISSIGQFNTYTVGYDEAKALQNPTLSRSHDLIASMIGELELKHYTRQWQDDHYEEIYLPTEPWMEQPDPKVPRQFFFANIFSDLFFRGTAYAYVTSRYSTGLPASMTWLPAANVSSTLQTGYPVYFGMSEEIQFNGQVLDTRDVIQFLSPVAGVLSIGQRAINTSIYLDQASDRMAQLETIPGYLQQVDGEDLSGETLGELANAWALARKSGNVIGALSRQVEFREFQNSPQEVISEQRKYQSLEIARLCNVPAYLVSAPTEGASMTYQNAQQARQDLWLFGASMYATAIASRLSMNDVLPRNRFVEFDIEEYLGSSDMSPGMTEPKPNNQQELPE